MLEEVSEAAGGDPVPLFAFRSCGRWHERRAGRMTIRVSEDDAIPTDVVGFTEELFRLAIADLQDVIKAFKAGKPGETRVAKAAIRDLREIGKDLVRERANVEALRKQVAGAAGTGGELDLGAARDEIGRRLACLRAARGD